jgi:hypothetical protein
MNKQRRLPTLNLSRTSLRPLTHDDDLRRVVAGRRNTITSWNDTGGGSGCDPMCVSKNDVRGG